jgi:hypothetical protein
MRPGQRRVRVRLGILRGAAHADPYFDDDAQLGTGALGEGRYPESVGRRGQRSAGRDDEKAMVAEGADRGVHPLRFLHQEAVHGEPQFLPRRARR